MQSRASAVSAHIFVRFQGVNSYGTHASSMLTGVKLGRGGGSGQRWGWYEVQETFSEIYFMQLHLRTSFKFVPTYRRLKYGTSVSAAWALF